jgi:hypothetical protein
MTPNTPEEKLPIELVPQFFLGALYDRFTALLELERGCEKFPFKLAWQIDDLKELLKPFATKYEVRMHEILKRFGEPAVTQTKVPGQVTYNIKDPVGYKKATEELFRTEVEFDERKIKAISVAELEKVKDLVVAPEALRILRSYGMLD